MVTKSKQHDKEFEINAVNYVNEHPDFALEECCVNLAFLAPVTALSYLISLLLLNNTDLLLRIRFKLYRINLIRTMVLPRLRRSLLMMA